MRFPATQVGQIPAVALQIGTISIETVKNILLDGHDLRGFKATGRAHSGHHGHELAMHGLICGVAGINIRLAHGIIGKGGHLFVHLLHQSQIGKQFLASIAKLAGIGGKGNFVSFNGGQFLFPGLVIGENIFHSPGILHGDLMALADLFHFGHDYTSR